MGVGTSTNNGRWRREDTVWWLLILGGWGIPTLFRASLQAVYGYSNPVLTPFIRADWLIVLPFILLAAYGVRVAWRRRRRATT